MNFIYLKFYLDYLVFKMKQNITNGVVVYHNFMENDISIDTLENTYVWSDFTINGKKLLRTGCFEGLRDPNGCQPWLRCPSIEHQTIYPYSSLTMSISERIKQLTGYNTNIAKIQKYNDGKVGINLHADKIIDLAIDTPIFVVRFGEERICVLEHKITKDVIEVPVPHNSLLVISYKANLEWKHGIKEDKTKKPSYSIVFRKSVTFLHPCGIIFGERTPFKNIKALEEYKENVKEYYTKEEQSKKTISCYKEENKRIVSLDIYKEIINNCIYPF